MTIAGSRYITRIAPTPSGYLHIGNLFSFAITWALAKQNNGSVILRIDDIDNQRYRPNYVTDIFETLAFLGIDYNHGPRNLVEFEQQYSQQLKLNRYNQLTEQLKNQNIIYACTCSRSEINRASDRGLYSRQCAKKLIHLNTPDATWRVKTPQNHWIKVSDKLAGTIKINIEHTMPDFVVRRKDGLPAYQIASLADDIDMGVTHIVRGMDLIDSTAAQLYLANQLGEKHFSSINFIHHPLITNSDGNKLSKSNGDTSIYGMRKNGITPQQVWSTLAKQANITSSCISTAQNFAEAFNLSKIKA